MYDLEGNLSVFRGGRERKTMAFAKLTPMTGCVVLLESMEPKSIYREWFSIVNCFDHLVVG
jgi:hypothetical protein